MDHKSLQHIFDQKELNMRQRRWIKFFSDYECEIRYHPSKANMVADALSRKERVKPRHVRAMAMTIISRVKRMILAAQSKAFKEENAPTKMLHGLDQLMERKEDGGIYFIQVPLIGNLRTLIIDEVHASRYLVHPRADKTYYDLRDMYGGHRSSSGYDTNWVIFDRPTKSAYLLAIPEDYKMENLARLYIDKIVAGHGLPVSIISDCNGRFTSSYHLSIRFAPLKHCMEGSVVLIKEKLKAAIDRQKTYAGNRRNPLEFEVGDQVLLKVPPWKGVIRFGKKGKLAPRYVGPFEILERVGPLAYRLRLPEELSSVHDTFHVSNLKKCLAEANLHVPLDEIKVDKTLCFVEEPIEIIDREVKSLKHSKISIGKVRWNSKRGPEFMWEREDHMKVKYPRLFVDRAVEPTSQISRQNFLKNGIL
ncbi:putative reverse transcriptase domain-containing protein [Tanacetum coccineum]